MNYDRVFEMIEQAYEAPYGPVRTNLFEQAVSEAEQMGDEKLAYDLRIQLIESAFFHGLGDRALVSFVSCLRYADENPEDVSQHELLWRYKWIVGVLPRLPQISRSKILEMVNDLGRRASVQGYSPRPVHYVRWKQLLAMGDLETASTEVELWRKGAKDELQDCPACEADSEVEYLAACHRDQQALAVAKPILSGKVTCAEVPHLTLGILVRPLIRLGRMDDCQKISNKGYKLTYDNNEFISAVSEHLLFATRTNQIVKALRMFTRHAAWAVDTGLPLRRFQFDSIASAFLEKLARKGVPKKSETDESRETRKRMAPAKLVLPSNHPCYRDDDQYDPRELAKWYRNEAESLADQFNKRNGNDYFTRWLEETHDLADIESRE